MVWNKVWVKPQGCVVKVFLREESEGSQKNFREKSEENLEAEQKEEQLM